MLKRILWIVLFVTTLNGCALLVDSICEDKLLPYVKEYRPNPNIKWHYVDGERVQQICGAFTFGCAMVPENPKDVCHIYVEPNPPEWLIKHEKDHCHGLDHCGVE